MEQLPDRTITFVRALMGVVRFERDVFASIDQVIAVARGAAAEYRAAIDLALASDVRLANLGPEYHPEVIVRSFLSEVRRRLVDLAPPDPPIFN